MPATTVPHKSTATSRVRPSVEKTATPASSDHCSSVVLRRKPASRRAAALASNEKRTRRAAASAYIQVGFGVCQVKMVAPMSASVENQ